MDKPQFLAGYAPDIASECERLLVTVIRGLGPWRESVYLIGGLTPRYLRDPKHPNPRPHAGTGDVDVVVDLQMLADIEAYATLEANLKKLGFQRDENAKHQKISWRWFRIGEKGHKLILELLADDPKLAAAKVQELPTKGTVSALNVPHSSMVFDFHDKVVIAAELLDGGGMYEATIRYADIVTFTCLKALAYTDRWERKDAHDLIYCLEHWAGGVDGAAKLFMERAGSKHGPVLANSLDRLRAHFVTTTTTGAAVEGYTKDGPVAVAFFELGEDVATTAREARILRQREASDVIERLLAAIEALKAGK